MDPQPRPVHRLADAGEERHEQEADRTEAEEVLVVLQPPVVLAQKDERRREDRDADDDPERLQSAVLGIEASDRRQADGRHQRGEGEKTSVCVGNRPSNDHVGTQVEGGEHGSVPRRSVRDLDRHRRERGPRDPGGDEERRELAIARGHLLNPK